MRTLLSTENILRFANFLVVFGIPRMLYMEVTSFTNYDPASCFHQFPFGKFEKATRAVSKTTGSANHGYVEHVSAFLAPVVKTGDRKWSYELCVRYCQFFQFRTNLNHRIHTLSKCVLFQDLKIELCNLWTFFSPRCRRYLNAENISPENCCT